MTIFTTTFEIDWDHSDRCCYLKCLSQSPSLRKPVYMSKWIAMLYLKKVVVIILQNRPLPDRTFKGLQSVDLWYSNFTRRERCGRSGPGAPGVAMASSEVMLAHFLSGGSGTTHRWLKMAPDASLCLICVRVWPWGPAWMQQEQGDRVQLLPLNADTHAARHMRIDTRTITI